jgi:phosphohistidine phosphatase SixA
LVVKIYLVRHGKAADEGYRFDEDRPLTDEGRDRMRVTAKAWKKQADGAPDLWLVSPLVRAVQTCEICVDAFGASGPVEVTRALTPDAPLSAILERVDREGVETLALVSHEPLCSTLGSHLLAKSFLAGFKKGAVLAVKRTDAGRPAKLLWYLEPAKDDREPRFRDEV